MAIPGKKPKSIAEKDLAGTVRPSRRKTGLPPDLLGETPEPPEWLNPEAQEIFLAVCDILKSKRILDRADINLVAIYSHEYWTYQTAVKNLSRAGSHIVRSQSGYEQPSPWVAIRNQAQKNVRDIGQLFGLDPLNRNRFDGNKKETTNALQAILNKYN